MMAYTTTQSLAAVRKAALGGRRALASTASAASQHVLGCGSNVMDLFFPVRKLPQPGDKQYYAAESCLTDAVVGGVTLNHLSWARALGAPTGLMALQGKDTNGETIRAKMAELGVSSEFVRVGDDYSTSVSHILSGPDGERTILMAPASTSRLTATKMKQEFHAAVSTRASMLTTEISQVPLSGVEYLLDASILAKIPSLLDVDVTPSTATGSAQLGTMDELRRCVTKASVLKLTASAAAELLALVSNKPLESSLENVAQQLADAFGAKLCVVTDGSRGSALALGRTAPAAGSAAAAATAVGARIEAVSVPIYAGVTQKDATGAGDAFFGGIIASLHHWGFPGKAEELQRVGRVAAASGAACVEVVGALPVPSVSSPRMLALCADAKPLVDAAGDLDKTSAAGAAAAAAAGTKESDIYDAWLSSLLKDSDALSDVASHYTLNIATAADSVSSLVSAIKACASSSPKSSHVYCTGIGKSGAVAARLAISLRSIGIRASFVHGSEWSHGDLGAAGGHDVILAFSHSGKTAELIDVAARIKAKGGKVYSITNDGASPLGKASAGHFPAPAAGELLDTIPTRSIVSQEAVCNAVVSGVAQALQLTKEQFKANHPGGSIGGQTVKVAPAS